MVSSNNGSFKSAGDPVEAFTVKAELVELDDGLNELAMSGELKFDVQVYALQKASLD